MARPLAAASVEVGRPCAGRERQRSPGARRGAVGRERRALAAALIILRLLHPRPPGAISLGRGGGRGRRHMADAARVSERSGWGGAGIPPPLRARRSGWGRLGVGGGRGPGGARAARHPSPSLPGAGFGGRHFHLAPSSPRPPRSCPDRRPRGPRTADGARHAAVPSSRAPLLPFGAGFPGGAREPGPEWGPAHRGGGGSLPPFPSLKWRHCVPAARGGGRRARGFPGGRGTRGAGAWVQANPWGAKRHFIVPALAAGSNGFLWVCRSPRNWPVSENEPRGGGGQFTARVRSFGGAAGGAAFHFLFTLIKNYFFSPSWWEGGNRALVNTTGLGNLLIARSIPPPLPLGS